MSTTLPKTVTSMTSTDRFLVDQTAGPAEIASGDAMSSLGTTFSDLTTAAATSDTDGIMVTQGGDTLLAQSFGAVWSWVIGKLPLVKQPTVGVSGVVTLDTTLHNNAHLFATGPATIHAPASFGNLGDGFHCSLNANGHAVTLDLVSGIGMTSWTGASTYSAGRAVFEATVNGNGGPQLLVDVPATTTVTPPSGNGSGTTILSVTPTAVGNLGSPLAFAFTYSGADPTSVGPVPCVASAGKGTFSVTPILVGLQSYVVGGVSTLFYVQPTGTPGWAFSNNYNSGPPITPRSSTLGNPVRPILTVTAPTSDTPSSGTTNLWLGAWSTSQTVPPASFPLPDSIANWSPLSNSVGWTGNAPGTALAGKTVFAWLQAPSGFVYVDATPVVLT